MPPGDPRPPRFQRALVYSLDDLRKFAKRLEDGASTVYVLGDRGRAGLDGLKELGDWEEKSIDELFPY